MLFSQYEYMAFIVCMGHASTTFYLTFESYCFACMDHLFSFSSFGHLVELVWIMLDLLNPPNPLSLSLSPL